jgi:uroporphyrinogen decarboxylase
MTSRERAKIIFSGNEADRTGFWLGKPHEQTWPIYLRAFGCEDEESVRRLLGDDFRWICFQYTCYRHPQGKPIFDTRPRDRGLAAAGVFADCEDPADVASFPWPDPDLLDLDEWLWALENAGEVYRASGFWCPFFHDVAAFFGMENYFVKMYTHPEVVHAVTRRVVDFYLEANRRLYARAGELIDGLFFGNDFGSQLDLLFSPAQFQEFVLPYMRELVCQAKGYGYQVILHSCGSVYKVLPNIVELGINALHPLQARAANMDAETLSKTVGGRIAFLGGVDTQQLLVHGTPEQVRAEVHRLKRVLGPCLVVSPSHEALLPNVPPENVLAMAQAATEPAQ